MNARYVPRPLITFLVVSAVFTMACLVTNKISSHFLRLGMPYNHPVATGVLGDLVALTPIMGHLHDDTFFQSMKVGGQLYKYPPSVVFFYVPFFLLNSPYREASMYGLILLTFLVTGALFGRALLREHLDPLFTIFFLLGTAVMSFPLWYQLDAGNMEIFNFILLLVSVWALCNDKWMLAAVCMGISAGMKISPIVLVGLLVAKRKYRESVLVGVVAVAMNLIALNFISSSFSRALRGVRFGLNQYSVMCFRTIDHDAVGFDHSFFTVVKRIYGHFSGNIPHITPVYDGYLLVMAIGGLILFFTRIRKLPFLNQVIVFTVAMVALPPSSYEYTLMSLYIPFGLLVLFIVKHRGEQIPGLTALVVCFAGMFSTFSEFIYHRIVFGAQITVLFEIATLLFALNFPLANAEEARALMHERALGPRQLNQFLSQSR